MYLGNKSDFNLSISKHDVLKALRKLAYFSNTHRLLLNAHSDYRVMNFPRWENINKSLRGTLALRRPYLYKQGVINNTALLTFRSFGNTIQKESATIVFYAHADHYVPLEKSASPNGLVNGVFIDNHLRGVVAGPSAGLLALEPYSFYDLPPTGDENQCAAWNHRLLTVAESSLPEWKAYLFNSNDLYIDGRRVAHIPRWLDNPSQMVSAYYASLLKTKAYCSEKLGITYKQWHKYEKNLNKMPRKRWFEIFSTVYLITGKAPLYLIPDHLLVQAKMPIDKSEAGADECPLI